MVTVTTLMLRLVIFVLTFFLGYGIGTDWSFTVCSLLGIAVTACVGLHLYLQHVKPLQ